MRERQEVLRARLAAVGALLGFDILVTEDSEWTTSGGVLRVGLGWYESRGVPEHEAAPLALLALWEGPRAAHAAVDRARRIRALSSRFPAWSPLLGVIGRLQAMAEALTAFPVWRAPLAAGLLRQLPGAPGELPRHLQWTVLVLERGVRAVGGLTVEAVETRGLAPEVVAEWRALALVAPGTRDPLGAVLRADPGRTPLARFERALALVLPGFQRLLALDAADLGLTSAAGAPEGAHAQDDEAALERQTDGVGASGSDDAEGAADGSESDHAEGSEPGSDTARRGEGRQSAEGSDLFAAEQAGFVSEVLATPMPAGGALIEAMLELPRDALARDPAGAPGERGTAGSTGTAPTSLAEYRRRARELEAPIEHMREVWSRIIDERRGSRAALSRAAHREGEELATDALPGALAELSAGVPRPAAYRTRVHRNRRQRRSGSTDYVLLVDRSASMQGPPARAAADAMIVLAESLAGVARDIAHAETQSGVDLELEVRTALIAFGAEPTVLKPLSRGIDDSHRSGLHGASNAQGGATNDAAAIRAAAREFGIVDRASAEARAGAGAGAAERAGGPSNDGIERTRVLIVVSDGGTNDEFAAARELRRLRAAGVRIIGIGVGANELVARYGPSGISVQHASEVPGGMLGVIERELE